MSKKPKKHAAADNADKVARIRISRNLKTLRKEHKLSQEKLAEAAGFHRTYISQLERCITNVSIDGLQRIATALGVDVLDLLQPAEEVGPRHRSQ